MRRLVVALVVPLALLSGCGGEEPKAERDSTPSEASGSAPKGPQTYGTVAQLKDAAVAAGYACPNWTQDDVVDLAAESGTCSDADVFSTYASEGDLQAQLATDRELDDAMADYGLESDPALVGPNWIITGPDAPDLAEALGGTVER